MLTPLALFDVAERDANHYCCASHKTGTMKPVHVIGGGLAGSEAAWQLARAGVPVVLHEVRPERGTDAHQTDGLAERGGAVEGVLEGAPGEPGKPAEDSFELPPDPLNR